MFRCPGCAKVYKLPLTLDYSLLSNTDMNKFYIVKEPFFKDGNLINAFNSMVKEVESLDEAIFWVQEKTGETVEFYQTCYSCKETHSMEDWVAAKEQPMEFFDAENLCGCGGELWMDRIPYSGRYGLICEKCEWVKPASMVSSSADATVR